jgi:hypothetical protein
VPSRWTCSELAITGAAARGRSALLPLHRAHVRRVPARVGDRNCPAARATDPSTASVEPHRRRSRCSIRFLIVDKEGFTQ